jgi:hypothetical protein
MQSESRTHSGRPASPPSALRTSAAGRLSPDAEEWGATKACAASDVVPIVAGEDRLEVWEQLASATHRTIDPTTRRRAVDIRHMGTSLRSAGSRGPRIAPREGCRATRRERTGHRRPQARLVDSL